MRRALLPLLVILLMGCLIVFQSSCSSCGPTKYAGVKVVNMIPASLSAETNQDSEPFLAIHPTNSQWMAASAFTPNPGGQLSTTAPIYVSQDGGQTWTLNNIVPSPVATSDITHAFDGGGGNLYAGILRSSDVNLLELVTTNFTSASSMTTQASRANDDQPFVRATTVGGNNRIYIGNNDTSQDTVNGRTATVDVSGNGGTNYTSVRLESRTPADISGCTVSPASQDGPSVRPSFAKDGVVYAAYFGWRTFNGNCASATVTSDVVVVRDDHGATGNNPFQDLKDPNDNKVGNRAVTGITIPWSNQPTLSQERTGSTLSIAVDPNNSLTVYLCWADRVGSGDIYTIHVRNSTNKGASWSKNDLFSLKDATNCALAVADNGTVGLLDQAHVGAGVGGLWLTHLVQTKNAFGSVQDGLLASTPSDEPASQFLPYLGDYVGLLAVGNEFRGVFCANNRPDKNNFPQDVTYQRVADFTAKTLGDGQGGTVAVSIDPFYFSFPVMQ